MTTFRGFNTVGRLKPPYTLTDIELVKRDLLNEFHTRLGERVMQPEFGTIIFDMLMEPSDELTKDAIKRDAIRIVRKDPRVKLSGVTVTEVEDAILLEISLLYHPQNVTTSLYVTYQLSTTSAGTVAGLL